MINHREKLELSSLILAAKDGALDKEQFAKLDSMIANDPTAAEHYVEFVMIYAALTQPNRALTSLISPKGDSASQPDIGFWQELAEYEKNGKAVEVERVEEKVERVLTTEEREAKIRAFIAEERAMEAEEQRLEQEALHKIRDRQLRLRQRAQRARNIMQKVRRYSRNAAMAAMLMVIGYLLYAIMQPVPVARLTDAAGAQWSDSDLPTHLDASLRPGRMKLIAGFAEITFNEGAKIILEAPAGIKLESASRAFAQAGRIAVEVPPPTQNFVINTPSASMVDLGTEFGVQVKEDGTSDLYVFNGKVALVAGPIGKKANGFNGNGAREQIVRAGQARRVRAGSSQIQDIRFDQTAFVRDMPSPYELAVRRMDPTGYWRFGSDNRKKCVNTVDSTRHFAKYVGSIAFDENGPDLGDGKPNDTLKLDGRANNYMIIENITSSRLQRNGFSLVLWLRADEIRDQSIITNETKDGQATWFSRYLFMEENGQLAFIVYSDDDQMYEGEPVETCLIRSRQTAETGRWYHLTVTLSPNRVCLFIDGRLEAEDFDLIDQFDDFDLSWYLCTSADIEPETDEAHAPPINGAIDEIAMYNRVLSTEEIRQLYSCTITEYMR
jgi:hypothetical protein